MRRKKKNRRDKQETDIFNANRRPMNINTSPSYRTTFQWYKTQSPMSHHLMHIHIAICEWNSRCRRITLYQWNVLILRKQQIEPSKTWMRHMTLSAKHTDKTFNAILIFFFIPTWICKRHFVCGMSVCNRSSRRSLFKDRWQFSFR